MCTTTTTRKKRRTEVLGIREELFEIIAIVPNTATDKDNTSSALALG